MDETDRLQGEFPLAPIAPKAIRYIKLGKGGEFARGCIAEGCVGLGFDRDPSIPHEWCVAGEWDRVRTAFIQAGKTAGKASDHTRELTEFYTAGADTLWITFADGRLHWAFADAAVEWDPERVLPRRRRMIGSWRNTNLGGETLDVKTLSTRLTSVGAYRGTICDVRAGEYLLQKINGVDDPVLIEASAAQAQVLAVAQKLIAQLHHHDFEIMVDLIFAMSGWRRASVLGGMEADIDLIVDQVATGERAFVQVKSRASVSTLKDYIERFRAYPGCTRMFFVCHTPAKKLAAHNPPEQVDLWTGAALAEKAVMAGLFDWLIERVR